MLLLPFLLLSAVAAPPPKVQSHKSPLLTVAGLQFRDLNRNGRLDPYEDWRLPVETRLNNLLSLMTPEEKAGLLIHSSLSGFTGPNGEVLGLPAGGGRSPFGPSTPPANLAERALKGRANMNNVQPMGSANPTQLIAERHIRYILVRPNANEAPAITATFHNGLQEMAEASRLGIPIVFSTDPRHSASRAPSAKPVISIWPDQLGLAAAADPALTRQFGQVAARELRALGISCLLGPMADIATEPRWNRINGTFGEDPETVAAHTSAIIEGLQGAQLGPASVLTVTKHFPGDGPVKDGYDPHNNYGKWTIYPGNQFDLHLAPFRAALAAKTGGIMGGYFIPVGHDTVAINYSKAMLNGLLRSKLGFQGLVVTDWLRNMPWGVEKLSEKDRQKQMILSGVDQIGGDNDPSILLASIKDGSLPAEVLNTAARRALRPAFQLGLFENPYVDPAQAANIVASEANLAAGYTAQLRSTVLLKNANGLLPAAPGRRIYVEGIDRAAAAKFGTVVDDPKQADLAILRIATPSTNYPYGGAFALGMPRGGAPTPPAAVATYGITLAYANAANWQVLDQVRKVAASGTPTVVIVNMDKPAILSEFIESVPAVFAAFGASDAALLDLVFGKAKPTGKLPIDLPADMPSVMSQAADVPFDIDDPLFRHGFGLTYNR